MWMLSGVFGHVCEYCITYIDLNVQNARAYRGFCPCLTLVPSYPAPFHSPPCRHANHRPVPRAHQPLADSTMMIRGRLY